MASLNKVDFESKYNHASTGLFKTNTSNAIGSDDLRAEVTDLKDSVLWRDGDFIDEDSMASDSATKVPSQQSVKAYVDAAALGIVTAWKAPVRVSTTVAGTLATSFENGDTVDGVVLATGNRILIKNQASATENGIYVVAASGAPARASDANAAAELEGVAVGVQEGTTNANTVWLQTTDGITLGSSNIVWVAFGSGGAVSDTVYGSGWNGDTTNGASKNALYDKIQTLSSIAPRVQSVTSSATVTPDADADDMVVITAQAAGLTLANPTGTPAQGQGLIIRVKDNGTARAITFDTLYRDLGVSLPTTTTISKTTYIVCIYNSTDTKWDVVGVRTEDEVVTGGSAYWTTVPGTPVRVGNTSFTITDTANANLYDLLLSRKTVLKWTDTGVVKMAMVVSATYSSNDVTITIIGDTLSSGATMNTFKYSFEKAHKVTFAYAGVLATGTNISRKYKADCITKVFGADGLHGTAGTTNATTYDINKNGTTFMTTKLSIASAATVGDGFTADSGTELAVDDVVSLDCDSVSTTQPIDVYVDLFIFPKQNIYLS